MSHQVSGLVCSFRSFIPLCFLMTHVTRVTSGKVTFNYGKIHHAIHTGKSTISMAMFNPIGSMYGIYANTGGILMVNVTIYSVHGSYGIVILASEGFTCFSVPAVFRDGKSAMTSTTSAATAVPPCACGRSRTWLAQWVPNHSPKISGNSKGCNGYL